MQGVAEYLADVAVGQQSLSEEAFCHSISLADFSRCPETEASFREELLRVLQPSQTEIGCLRIDVFESIREPCEFVIHSEWADRLPSNFTPL